MTKQKRIIATTKKPKPLLTPQEDNILREAWLARKGK